MTSSKIKLCYWLTHFNQVLHFIWKPVIWFAVKIKWLVSIWNAIHGWNALIWNIIFMYLKWGFSSHALIHRMLKDTSSLRSSHHLYIRIKVIQYQDSLLVFVQYDRSMFSILVPVCQIEMCFQEKIVISMKTKFNINILIIRRSEASPERF